MIMKNGGSMDGHHGGLGHIMTLWIVCTMAYSALLLYRWTGERSDHNCASQSGSQDRHTSHSLRVWGRPQLSKSQCSCNHRPQTANPQGAPRCWHPVHTRPCEWVCSGLGSRSARSFLKDSALIVTLLLCSKSTLSRYTTTQAYCSYACFDCNRGHDAATQAQLCC